MAPAVKRQIDGGRGLTDGFIGNVIYSALATAELNACMGRIVAAPTAGSCGIVPACLAGMENYHGTEPEAVVMSLFNAAAIGMIIAKNASIAGAEGGCQAECGSAAAMAAAAMVELKGGTPGMSANACAFALESILGLVCDPVAGLVEVPCVVRNASCAMTAVTAAELALAGIESLVPADEVIDAMQSISKQMPPSLRETAEGGIAASPAAREFERKFFAAR
jgi:L-serine dehydratase